MADIDTAKAMLLSLIYPVTENDMSEEQRNEFLTAAAEQLDFSNSYKGDVVSESVGDVKIHYDIPTSSKPKKYYGMPVCPLAIGRLTRCGLIRRWI